MNNKEHISTGRVFQKSAWDVYQVLCQFPHDDCPPLPPGIGSIAHCRREGEGLGIHVRVMRFYQSREAAEPTEDEITIDLSPEGGFQLVIHDLGQPYACWAVLPRSRN